MGIEVNLLFMENFRSRDTVDGRPRKMRGKQPNNDKRWLRKAGHLENDTKMIQAMKNNFMLKIINVNCLKQKMKWDS